MIKTTLEDIYKPFKIFGILMVIPLGAGLGLSSLLMTLFLIIDLIYAVYAIYILGKRVETSISLAELLVFFWIILVFIIFGFEGAERIVQYSCIVMTLYVTSTFRLSERDFRFIGRVIQLQLLLYILWWPLSGFTTNYYTAFYIHSNFLGNMLFHSIVVLLIVFKKTRKRSFLASVFVALPVLIVANSRSSIIALLIFLVSYWLLNVMKYKNAKRTYLLLLIGSVCLVIGFTIIYPMLYGSDIGITLELLSRKYFNKNFFSGREVIWSNMEEQIMTSPIVGLGLDKEPGYYYNTSYSSHNLWLQLALQMGITGLILMAIFLLVVQYRIAKGDNPLWRISVSFFIALIFHECFEVSLTQNNLAVGLISWLIFGIMLSERRTAWEQERQKSISPKLIYEREHIKQKI